MTLIKNLMTVFAVSLLLLGVNGCAESSKNVDVEISQNDELLSAPAELVSLQDVTIGPPNVPRMWQFKIEYLVPENTLVEQGDVVVRFDGQRVKNDLVGKQSELDAAIKEAEKQALKDEATEQDKELALAEAKMNRDIAQRKVEITDASRSDIERRKQIAEYEITSKLYEHAMQKLAQHKQRMQINKEVQNARISNLQVRVKSIQDSINKLVVKAPKKGLVIYQADWEDNKPAVGETVFMGRQLANLPSLDRLAVKVEFDESHSSRVQVGQSVKVLLDAHPEKPFAGKITSLGQAYRHRSQHNLKVVFDAWVELDSLDATLMRPGMKANVQVMEKGS